MHNAHDSHGKPDITDDAPHSGGRLPTLAWLQRRHAGISTVEAILIIFVAAVILLVLLQVIWPNVLQNVQDKLSELFSQTGQ